MSPPVAVLVAPVGDSGGSLLALVRLAGQGWSPQLAPGEVWREPSGDWSAPWDPYDTDGPLAIWPVERALALWWDSALVVEGWDRARRALFHHPDLHPAFRDALRSFGPDDDDDDMSWPGGRAEWAAVELVRLGLGARVVLLDSVDGRLVERSP